MRLVFAISTLQPNRANTLGRLLFQIAEQCPCVPVCVAPHAPNTPAWIDYINALDTARRMNSDWIVALEDDAFLAPDFGPRTTNALSYADTNGESVVLLYGNYIDDLRAMDNGITWRRQTPRAIWGSVGIAIRSVGVDGLRKFATAWHDSHPEHVRASDLMIREWFACERMKVGVPIPSLVQHADAPSTVGNNTGRPRFSRSFRRHYGALEHE